MKRLYVSLSVTPTGSRWPRANNTLGAGDENRGDDGDEVADLGHTLDGVTPAGRMAV